MLKARGKRNFILRVGVLQFGGAMFVLMTGQELLKKPIFPRTLVDYAVEIAIGLLIWPLAGYMFGAQMWRFNETYFDELNRRNHG